MAFPLSLNRLTVILGLVGMEISTPIDCVVSHSRYQSVDTVGLTTGYTYPRITPLTGFWLVVAKPFIRRVPFWFAHVIPVLAAEMRCAFNLHFELLFRRRVAFAEVGNKVAQSTLKLTLFRFVLFVGFRNVFVDFVFKYKL